MLAFKTKGDDGSDWRCYVCAPPFKARLILGSPPSDIPLRLEKPARVSFAAQGEDPPLVEPLEGRIEIDGTAIRKSRELAAGMRIAIAERTFTVVEGAGFLVVECRRNTAAEPDRESAGLDVFDVPAQFTVYEQPQQVLAELAGSLHLSGVGAVQVQPDGTVTEEFWSGGKWREPLERYFEIPKRGLMFLESASGRSIALAAYHWPEGEDTILIGWAKRPLSLGYLANLYRACPQAAASLLLSRRVRAISESAANEWLSALGALAIGVSDIHRDALTSVSGYSQLSRDDPAQLEKLQQSVNAACAESEELTRLLVDLSPWADTTGRPVRMGTVLSSLRRLFLPAFRRLGISLEVEGRTTDAVQADCARLHRLLFLLFYHLLVQTPPAGRAVLRTARKGNALVLAATPDADRSSEAGVAPTQASPPCIVPPANPVYLLLIERLASDIGGHTRRTPPNGCRSVEVHIPLPDPETG